MTTLNVNDGAPVGTNIEYISGITFGKVEELMLFLEKHSAKPYSLFFPPITHSGTGYHGGNYCYFSATVYSLSEDDRERLHKLTELPWSRKS